MQETMKKKSPLLPRKAGFTSESSNTPRHVTSQSSTSSSNLSSGATVHCPSTPHASTSIPTWSYSYAPCDELTVEDAVVMPNGTSESSTLLLTHDSGGMDGGTTPDRTRAAIEHTLQKIAHTKELIKEGQNSRDENVNEYLKLAANADKQQLHRIKNVFEKKNQKSAQAIAQLQKKLEMYNKRLRELEMHGLTSSHWQPREVLRDMGQGLKDVGANIKEGITGFSGGVVGNIKGGLSGLTQATHNAAETVMSKPREFAHLIKNRFGSADNISSLDKYPQESDENQTRNIHGSATFTHCSTKYTSDDEISSLNSGSGQLAVGGSYTSPQHQPQPGAAPAEPTSTLSTAPLVADLAPILQELSERRDESNRLAEEVEMLKNQIQQEYSFFNQALLEERYRYERLEEQMNDLIELHQNEIQNLKQGLADIEEKVQYQNEERLRDVHELLDNCQTRVSRMEHQQHQHLQQLVSLDSLDGSNARALFLKLINVVLTVLQVVLLLVATIASVLMPFIQTRLCILATAAFVLSVVMLCRQWPELLDWGKQFLEPYITT